MDKKLTPDIDWTRDAIGDTVSGLIQDLIAAGIIEPDWIAERPKRVKQFWVGGRLVRTSRMGPWCTVRIHAYMPSHARPPKICAPETVAWSDCAWQPGPGPSRGKALIEVMRQMHTKAVKGSRNG